MTRKPLTIAVWNQKGGCGKTSTTINLATTLSNAGTTGIIEIDPQCTARIWLKRRDSWHENDANTAINPIRHQYLGDKSPTDVAACIKKAKNALDFTIIDTQPRIDTMASAICSAADIIVVPISPTITNAWSIKETLELLKKLGKEPIIYPNQCTGRKTEADLIAHLSQSHRTTKPSKNSSCYDWLAREGLGVGDNIPKKVRRSMPWLAQSIPSAKADIEALAKLIHEEDTK